jgi:hypothetical protein
METWPRPGTLAESLWKRAQRAPFTILDLANEVDQLSVEHLEFIIACLIFQKLKSNDEPDRTFVLVGLAIDVLRFFMGNDWVNQNVFKQHKDVQPEHKEGRRFLRTENVGDGSGAGFHHQERVTNLASTLFNMQAIPGIKHRIAIMRNGDLESALGELQCAKIVSAPQFKLRFIVPTGQKGADYEAEFVTPNGTVICCEIKTKKEATPLTASTIRNTCETARKQLPKGRPGIIFLRIPQSWITTDENKKAVNAAIAKIFRQSDRLVAIVLVREVWASPSDGGRAVVYLSDTIYNTRSSHYCDDVKLAVQMFGGMQDPSRLHWHQFVTERIRSLTPAIKAALVRTSEGLSPDQGRD